METLGLMFKTLWAPGEAMFLLSKRPRALLPLVLMGLVSLGVGIVAISKVDVGELALRQAEQAGRTQQMSEEQKQRMVQMVRTVGRVGVGFAAVLPTIVILIATAISLGFPLDVVGQAFQKVATAKRVDDARDTAFVRDDLLGSERDPG